MLIDTAVSDPLNVSAQTRHSVATVMASLPIYHPDAVYHVGEIGLPRARSACSFEGPGLSVSEIPAAWRSLARLEGATWRLERDDEMQGRFLDLHAMPLETRDALLALAEDAGLITRQTVWVHRRYDDELEETLQMIFHSENDARAETDLDDEESITAEEGIAATALLADCWAAWFTSPLPPVLVGEIAMLALLDAATNTEREAPVVDGAWWHDSVDASRYSLPRGVIFPSRCRAWRAWLLPPQIADAPPDVRQIEDEEDEAMRSPVPLALVASPMH